MARLPSIASLFDSGLFVFSKEWKHLVSTVVVLSLPLYLLAIGMETNPALILPYFILSLIIGPLVYIITTGIIYYRYDLDKRIHSKGLYKYIHDRFFPVLWTTILSVIVIVLSMVLLAIPLAVLGIIYLIASQPALIVGGALSTFGMVGAVVLFVCFLVIAIGASVYVMFSLPISILEKKSGLNAINNSIRLVRGRWWNIFGRVFVLQLIAVFISAIVSVFAAAIVGTSSLGSLINMLLQQVLILPITIAFVVFYLEVRGKSSSSMKLSDSVSVGTTESTKKKTSAKRTSVKKTTTKKKSAKKKTVKKSSTSSKKKTTKRTTKKK